MPDSSPGPGVDARPGRATLHDVANRARVSHMTVSRYFRHPEKLSPATFERVKKAVLELQYVPNEVARSLVRGKSDLLSLLVADITNPFFTTLARGVEDEARRHGYALILGNTDESAEQEIRYLQALISRQVTGLVIAPSAGAEEYQTLLLDRNIPLVLVDRGIPGVPADLVRGDTSTGVQALVRHLLEHGHRDVAFVGGNPAISSLQDRLSGYRTVMAEAGLPERVYLGSYLQHSGEETMRALLAGGDLPGAIVAANNTVAAGILVVLREHGLHTPDDIAVACVDEVELSDAVDPFMTVVRQPAFEMGRAAMHMLIERINGFAEPPRERVLPTELIIRRSTMRRG